MVAIATFLPTTAAVIFGCLAFLVDMSAVILAYYHPVDVEQVTAESELNSTICSLMIVLISVFTITIILNVQQKKQAEELTSLSRQLEQAADHDALTGLYNRRYLNRYLERLVQKGKKDVYAALIDLDFFKKVNDEYGHAFGDEVLIEFARILERNLIADGIAVRRVYADPAGCDGGGDSPYAGENERRLQTVWKTEKEPGIYIQLWCGTVCRRYGCFGRLPAGG